MADESGVRDRSSTRVPGPHPQSGTPLHAQVLIFSFSVRVLDCIEEMMLAHGYVTERLDGSTPPDQRQQRVNDFNNSRGVFAFLISTTAGEL